MSTRQSRLGLTAGALLALTGCGDELAPAWQIRAFRLFGAKIENTTRTAPPFSDSEVCEAAPGEYVHLTLSYVDPSPTPRDLNVVWVLCAEATVTGTTFGCTARGTTPLVGVSVDYQLPTNIDFGVDPSNQPRIQAVAIACAGGNVGFDPTTRQPSCQGMGSESWVMTRSILVRTSNAQPPNHNPSIDRVSFIASGLTTEGAVEALADTPLHVPRCTTDPCPEHNLDVHVTAASRESYATFDLQGNAVTSQERLQFGFFTDKGTMQDAFRVDSSVVPNGPVRDLWQAPREPGEVHFYFTAQDPRGGFDVVTRTFIVD